MKPTIIFDTSIGSENLGDTIIMDYAIRNLREVLPNKYFVHLPTSDYLGRRSKGTYRNSEYKIVCGTNLLSAHMGDKRTKQWWLDILDFYFLRNVILMGVGWQQYEEGMDWYTKKLLQTVLSHEYLLSVRDSYTATRLNDIGFSNVINTSCHTTWALTPEFCENIPKKKANKVVTTITNYRKDVASDKYLLDILCQNYDDVYIWLQSYFDYKYLKSFFDVSRLHLIPSTLEAYDKVLELSNIDYVGTRLHAGIRALNYQKRTLIVGVDNRSREIAKDIHLNIILRKNMKQDLYNMINEELPNSIIIPEENIRRWKLQFK